MGAKGGYNETMFARCGATLKGLSHMPFLTIMTKMIDVQLFINMASMCAYQITVGKKTPIQTRVQLVYQFRFYNRSKIISIFFVLILTFSM